MDAFITGLLIISAIVMFITDESFRAFVMFLVGLATFGFVCWGLGTLVSWVLG